jgi:outer membrane receptor protein involved in Fe transport
VLHFTYGHYFQRPDAYFLYRNHTYTGLTKAGNWVGNPNLKPEKTVAYDIGLEHLFTPDLKASVTGYVKDVTNLVDNYKFILRKLQGTEVRIFQNADYANIKGLEFALQKRLNDGWGFTANYTFSVAKGRSTSYTEGAGEYDSAKRMNILGYDQTHTVNATLTLASSEKFNPLLRNWRANLLFKYGSGLPYTSYNSSVPNDARMPWTANFDLRINRTFNMGFADLQIFMDIFNLMNRQNVDWIGDARYYELYDDPSIIRYNELSGEMTRSPQVYSNERQFRFGMSVQF